MRLGEAFIFAVFITTAGFMATVFIIAVAINITLVAGIIILIVAAFLAALTGFIYWFVNKSLEK
jgi:hypothetical protein